MDKLIIKQDYKLKIKDRVGRYIGIGKHTKQYMFRDLTTGQIIFISERDLIGVTLK